MNAVSLNMIILMRIKKKKIYIYIVLVERALYVITACIIEDSKLGD